MSRPNPPNGEMRLSERRSAWRRLAGKMVPNLGRLASAVAMNEVGEIIPIFMTKGSFRVELDGQQFRFSRLAEAEAVAMGWLLRGEGLSDDALSGHLG